LGVKINKTLYIFSLFILLFPICIYAEETIQFSTLPNEITTNIDAFPVTGMVPETTEIVYINNVDTSFERTGKFEFDFFSVINLTQGENNITLRIIDNNGSEQNYTKTIHYDPQYSTKNHELLYANSRYLENTTQKKGIIVIDLRNKLFLGIIKNNEIHAITKDGKEIILNSGDRYSTTNHSYTGRRLPRFYQQCEFLFSSDGEYLYHYYYRINLSSNLVENPTLALNACSMSDISNNDSAIYSRYGYLDLTTNQKTTKDYINGSEAYKSVLRINPENNHIFHSSYASADGELNIINITETSIVSTIDGGDYAGDIVFSPYKAYTGSYGNTYFEGGGIIISDSDVPFSNSFLSLHGARSLATSKNGYLFASGFYTYNSGWKGKSNLRGIIQLIPRNNAEDLEIERTYFVNLESDTTEPYYAHHNIFYKQGDNLYACYSDLDCGVDGWKGNRFCSDDDLYQDYTTFTCNNPGTPTASCSNITTPQKTHECHFGCTTTCNKKPTSNGNVKIIGRDLFVNNERYKAKSIGYSPIPIGKSGESGYDITTKPELWERDFPYLRAMNTNTIRVWKEIESMAFMDKAWNNGQKPIRVIMGFWMDSRIDYFNPTVRANHLNNFRNYVTTYKDHPAVLVWAIGNEENHFYGGGDLEKHAAYFSLVEEMAQAAYDIEGSNYHPVLAVSLEMPNEMETVGNAAGGSDDLSLQHLDIWGINHYPGETFGDFFDVFEDHTSKALLITEYGIDAYNNTNKTEFGKAHSDWVIRQWKEINNSHAIGGSLMEYSDEWWKDMRSIPRSTTTQEEGGYPTDTHPDGYANEEWWGMMRIVDNGTSPDIVQPRQLYYTLKDAFYDGTGEIKNSITVYTNNITTQLNEMIFGTNFQGYNMSGYNDINMMDYGDGIWNPTENISVEEVVSLAKEAGMKIVRFPGGCGTHNYDWKETIGHRTSFLYGIDEFLQSAEDIGAEVVLTVSYFNGNESDAADLVEYLNYPNNGSNPNGGIDWAAERAANGHPEPYNITYFELGNEVDHGNHYNFTHFPNSVDPEDYAEDFPIYKDAMVAVDPTIKLGAVFSNYLQWYDIIIEIAGYDMDFAIYHSYPGEWFEDVIANTPAEDLFKEGLAKSYKEEDIILDMLELIEEKTGRTDVPIAITEHNALYLPNNPVPYRHSLGTALMNADLLRIFSRNNVNMANYWHFVNGVFGSIYTDEDFKTVFSNLDYKKRPNYYVYELYHNHFGDRLLKHNLTSETYTSNYTYVTEGEELGTEDMVQYAEWYIVPKENVSANDNGGILELDFYEYQDINYFDSYKFSSTIENNTMYRLSGYIKTENLIDAGGVSIQAMDSQGWQATRSAVNTRQINGTKDWTYVEAFYRTIPNATQIFVSARRISDSGPVHGKAYFKNISLEKVPEKYFKIPYLSVNTATNINKNKVYLMVVNKNMFNNITATIDLKDFTNDTIGKAWILNAPNINSTNEDDPNTVFIKRIDFTLNGSSFNFTFEKHSITALEISLNKSFNINITKGWNLFSPLTNDNITEDKIINLNLGWNLFGYSTEEPFEWSNALFRNASETKTLDQAITSYWIQGTIYYYNKIYKFIPGNDNYLRNNKGYWLYSMRDDIDLIIPNVNGPETNDFIPWEDAQVSNGSETKPVLESGDWIQTTIYAYDSIYVFIPNEIENIYPWKGYWLYANENLTLII